MWYVCVRFSLYLMGHLQDRSNLKRLKLTPSIYVTEWLKTQGYSLLKTALHFLLNWHSFTPLLFSFPHHTFKIKSLKPSNNPHQCLPLIAFAWTALFSERNGSGNSSSVIRWNSSLFQCHASRLNSNLNAAHFTCIWNLINLI